MKADDDTYIIAENLKKYLRTLDPSKPIYAGFRLKSDVVSCYISILYYLYIVSKMYSFRAKGIIAAEDIF